VSATLVSTIRRLLSRRGHSRVGERRAMSGGRVELSITVAWTASAVSIDATSTLAPCIRETEYIHTYIHNRYVHICSIPVGRMVGL